MLRGLDLRLGEGATALLGPSGSGKSTLLRLLNRLADPDGGTVRFRGEDVRSLDPLELRRRACLVPQLPAPLPGTVEDNVCYGPRLCDHDVDPEVLLLDEPTSALDEQARDGVERTLLELEGRAGLSMVIVTHDRAQAERLASKVVRIREGRIA